MRIVILGSGSKGNATYVEMAGVRMLIDVGLSYRSIENELTKLHTAVRCLDGVFITHSHTDHIRGLKTMLNKVNVPLFLGENTIEEIASGSSMDLRNYPRCWALQPDRVITLGERVTILPLRTIHDVQSFGFFIDSPEGNLVYVTDTGFLPRCYGETLRDRDYYIFESNYDPETLRTCKYTNYVKSRINSDKGHMSNEYSAHCISALVGPNTKKVVLAHISENSNTADLALAAHRQAMQGAAFPLSNIVCAQQLHVLNVV